MGLGKILELLGLREKITTQVKQIPSEDELKSFSLRGKLFSGYALDEHREPLDSEHKRTFVGELVFRFKYKYDKECGLKLVDLTERLIREHEELSSADIILTVPPSFTSRPYDPISFLTQELSRRIGIPYQKGILKRVRLTKLQKRIFHRKSKMENVRGAFKLTSKNEIRNKLVLLIDDIFDSGATLDEITRILKQAGVRNVYVITLTKTSWAQG